MNAPRVLFQTIGLIWAVAILASFAGAQSQEPVDGLSETVSGNTQTARVLRVTIADAIGPISAKILAQAVDEAEAGDFNAVLLALDTPGGLDASMRLMVQSILGSEVPVLVYVTPQGARAASAGLFVTLAAPVAAMAPGTAIGAASPVGLGGSTPDSTMAKKVTNDAAAYARSLAEKWGRNAEWAEEAVRNGVSLPAEEALQARVVDFLAEDIDDLFRQVTEARLPLGPDSTSLDVVDAQIDDLDVHWRDRILAFLSNPSLAYLLFLGGILGIAMELYNPGSILPGTVGGICLVLSFFALQQLPINAVGILLIVLSMVFFALEVKVPSYGVLSVGGVTSLVLGSLFLFPRTSVFRLGLDVMIPTVIIFSGFVLFAMYMAVRAQKRQATTGSEGMIGEVGEVVDALGPTGRIRVHGEYWNAIAPNAVASNAIPVGSRVRVRAIDGLTVQVELVTSEEVPS